MASARAIADAESRIHGPRVNTPSAPSMMITARRLAIRNENGIIEIVSDG